MKNDSFIDYKKYILKQNLLEKKNDTIVVIVCYNQIENVKKLVKFFFAKKM